MFSSELVSSSALTMDGCESEMTRGRRGHLPILFACLPGQVPTKVQPSIAGAFFISGLVSD